MASLPTLASLFVLFALACGEEREPEAAEETAPSQVVPVRQGVDDAAKAQRLPERTEAEAVLTAFASALLDGRLESIGEHLRIPDGLTDMQLAFFYKELRKKHVNKAGVALVLGGDFGPVAERLGEKAQKAADQLGLSVDETWVFGAESTPPSCIGMAVAFG